MHFRTYYEQLEVDLLSPFAAKSALTRGREKEITPCDIRTEFQRDRDRIIHCKSFRRLKHKTQMFLAPQGDHYRTRLTHTMEVSQIARTISRALRLNEDLTEAIALGHDLGHTPFGHTGERALNKLCGRGFHHNQQSLRVVEILENGGQGLNLTWEVRDGILHHSGASTPSTLEGQVVALSDRIAYINHDIDDVERAGLITAQDLPKQCVHILGDTHGKRINCMILDTVCASEGKETISMSKEIYEATMQLRDFMFQDVYPKTIDEKEEGRAEHLVEHLYHHFLSAPKEMPLEYSELIGTYGLEQGVCDYIAGMTDIYAIETYKRVFVPSPMK